MAQRASAATGPGRTPRPRRCCCHLVPSIPPRPPRGTLPNSGWPSLHTRAGRVHQRRLAPQHLFAPQFGVRPEVVSRTPPPLSSRRQSVSFGGFGLNRIPFPTGPSALRSGCPFPPLNYLPQAFLPCFAVIWPGQGGCNDLRHDYYDSLSAT